MPVVTPAGADDADDRSLVDRLRRGDEAAFAWLLDRYTGSLHRLARSYVATASVADEAVQETWLAVVTGIDRFEGRASLKTWLHRILVNIARTKGMREHRSIPFASLRSELDGDEPAVDPDRFLGAPDRHAGQWAASPVAWDEAPEDRLLSRETLAAVQHAIDDLPPNQRTVITLRDVQGWTSEEVCNVLEITETNQRVLLHRARSKVRGALETYFEDTTT
jgi:RNA polymerase sigma-70 factor (ECF subfamily)